MRTVAIKPDFESWRQAARQLLAAHVPPDDVLWQDSDQPMLLGSLGGDSPTTERANVPRQFVEQARLAACHRDPDRWNLLYRLLWRLTQVDDASLLQRFTDEQVHRLNAMAKAVGRDRHKMTAFVRFRAIEREGQTHYVAWHRPEHHIVELTAPFFRDRVGTMNWTILTPEKSVSWDGHALKYGPGVPARNAPAPDQLEDLWKTYYANIFNPARIKLHAMQKEMPRKHWPTLPETELIPQLIKHAPARVQTMLEAAPKPNSAADYLPQSIELPVLREAVQGCRGCELYCHATQAVFGEGPADAQIMLIGEQPGDTEDRAGRPFVGPAGQVLDDALRDAGLDRSSLYITNAVKHFKFEPRGKRRIHSKPNAREMQACRPWLESEIQAVKPRIIVALGATAAQTLLGAGFRLTQQRGIFVRDTPWAPLFIATYHPSALLRIPDPDRLAEARAAFSADLKQVAAKLLQADNAA